MVEAVSGWWSCTCASTGTATGEWTDSAVRRYVTRCRAAAGAAAQAHPCRLHDPQPAQGGRARGAYDDLEQRIAELREQEELDAIRPDLDGNQIMEILGLPPGREVGEAYRFLLDLRLEEGPLGPDEAERRLRTWWADRPH